MHDATVIVLVSSSRGAAVSHIHWRSGQSRVSLDRAGDVNTRKKTWLGRRRHYGRLLSVLCMRCGRIHYDVDVLRDLSPLTGRDRQRKRRGKVTPSFSNSDAFVDHSEARQGYQALCSMGNPAILKERRLLQHTFCCLKPYAVHQSYTKFCIFRFADVHLEVTCFCDTAFYF